LILGDYILRFMLYRTNIVIGCDWNYPSSANATNEGSAVPLVIRFVNSWREGEGQKERANLVVRLALRE
jgi:hypothetical protein